MPNVGRRKELGPLRQLGGGLDSRHLLRSVLQLTRRTGTLLKWKAGVPRTGGTPLALREGVGGRLRRAEAWPVTARGAAQCADLGVSSRISGESPSADEG